MSPCHLIRRAIAVKISSVRQSATYFLLIHASCTATIFLKDTKINALLQFRLFDLGGGAISRRNIFALFWLWPMAGRGYLFRPSGGDWCHVIPPLYFLRDAFPSRCECTVLWSHCGELWRADVRPSTNNHSAHDLRGGVSAIHFYLFSLLIRITCMKKYHRLN